MRYSGLDDGSPAKTEPEAMQERSSPFVDILTVSTRSLCLTVSLQEFPTPAFVGLRLGITEALCCFKIEAVSKRYF